MKAKAKKKATKRPAQPKAARKATAQLMRLYDAIVDDAVDAMARVGEELLLSALDDVRDFSSGTSVRLAGYLLEDQPSFYEADEAFQSAQAVARIRQYLLANRSKLMLAEVYELDSDSAEGLLAVEDSPFRQYLADSLPSKTLADILEHFDLGTGEFDG